VRAGIVAGEVSELKVLERVESVSGKVDTPARLTAKLKLKKCYHLYQHSITL
jgi:hypothetical protein